MGWRAQITWWTDVDFSSGGLSGLFTSSFFDGSMQNGLALKASHEILEVDSSSTIAFPSLHCPNQKYPRSQNLSKRSINQKKNKCK
jgi:hypothetical protein